MTAALLLEALTQFLKEKVHGHAAALSVDAPEVYGFDLPFKDPKQPPESIDFSYICVRPRKGTDPYPTNAEQLLSTVEMDIYFAIYHAVAGNGGVYANGGADLLNLMEFVRQSLLTQMVIDRRYRIERPYSWEIPLAQPELFWIGQASTVWTVQNVTEQFGGEFLHG